MEAFKDTLPIVCNGFNQRFPGVPCSHFGQNMRLLKQWTRLVSKQVCPTVVNGTVECMVERFSASDLCSDARVVRMGVRILDVTMVLVSFSKTKWLHLSCIIHRELRWFQEWFMLSRGNNVQSLDLVARICALYINCVLLLLQAFNFLADQLILKVS